MNDWTDEDQPKPVTRTSAGMCKPDCACQQDDAMTTPLDIEDYQ